MCGMQVSILMQVKGWDLVWLCTCVLLPLGFSLCVCVCVTDVGVRWVGLDQTFVLNCTWNPMLMLFTRDTIAQGIGAMSYARLMQTE